MLFKKKKLFKPGLHDIGEDELKFWGVFEITNADEGNLIIKARIIEPPIPDISKYTIAVEVKWVYEGEANNQKGQTRLKISRFN